MADLKTASLTSRLAQLGSQRWAVHFEGRRRASLGDDMIELTIGEPDVPTPEGLIEAAYQSMKSGRTRYAVGRGEPLLLDALASKYSARSGRTVTHENLIAFPGTQAALAICMMALVEPGDAVLVPDPYYATYEGVVRATGADFVPVPMSASNGFHLTAQQLRESLVPNARVLLLNSPHNPTGAVLSAAEIAALGEVCREAGLWILSDEVYEDLIYEGDFASPFDNDDLAERSIALSSISKSHAAPGFRSGWAVGPDWFTRQALSVAETILFGNQPFIADMTHVALTGADRPARLMGENYRRRIELLMDCFEGCETLRPLRPEAGMFMLVDVTRTGMDGERFALRLLDEGVSVMPGASFGEQAAGFIRLSLTVDGDMLSEAGNRMVTLAERSA